MKYFPVNCLTTKTHTHCHKQTCQKFMRTLHKYVCEEFRLWFYICCQSSIKTVMPMLLIVCKTVFRLLVLLGLNCSSASIDGLPSLRSLWRYHWVARKVIIPKSIPLKSKANSSKLIYMILFFFELLYFGY